MSSLKIRTALEANRIVVMLAGECDLYSRDELTSALRTAVDAAPLVVVDLAALQFLDSTGLHALVLAHHAARERAARLYVVNASNTVAAVLRVTGVMELLQLPTAGKGSPRKPLNDRDG